MIIQEFFEYFIKQDYFQELNSTDMINQYSNYILEQEQISLKQQHKENEFEEELIKIEQNITT